MPGDTHPETGEIIRMRTGNLWGDGVCVTCGVGLLLTAACHVLTFYELTLNFQTRPYFASRFNSYSADSLEYARHYGYCSADGRVQVRWRVSSSPLCFASKFCFMMSCFRT